MSIEMRGPDGQIRHIGMFIECEEYRTAIGEDGVIESIECVSRTVKPECKQCSLTNALKPQHESSDPKDQTDSEID